MTVQRIAGIGAAIAGVGAFTGTLLAGRGDDTPARQLLVSGGIAGAGALALGGGVGVARWGEQALRPGITRGARSAAAVGAALVAGAIAGTVTSFVADRFGQHRATDVARERRDAATARVDAAKEAAKQPGRIDDEAAHAKDLEAEAATAKVALQIDDGRVDLVGAPVSAAATSLLNQYDRDDNGLTLAEQQRTVGDKTFSIGATAARLLAARDKDEAGTPPIEDVGALEKFLSDTVDTGGRSGYIDVDEARAWYGAAGPGERNVTWGWKSHLDSIASVSQGEFQASLDKDRRTTWSLGEFDDGVPMLALPGADTLEQAMNLATEAAAEQRTTMAVVKLPDGAPTRFALASLQENGDEVWLRGEELLQGRLHDSGQAVVGAEASIRLDQARNATMTAAQPAGTVPVSGRTIEAVAADILERYDASGNGLWIGDAQRTDAHGHTFSIMPVLRAASGSAVAAKPAAQLKYDTVAHVASSIRAAAAGDGDPAILDGMEPTSWNSDYGNGERDITWGWDAYFKSVHDGTAKADADLELAPLADDVKLLALPGVYSLDSALDWAQQAAAAVNGTVAVVELPSDAPADYALASVTDTDGYGAELDDDLKRGRGLDTRVVGVADASASATIRR
jgi:hypothetical protein